jgi:hypothetical protein
MIISFHHHNKPKPGKEKEILPHCGNEERVQSLLALISR